MRVKAVVGGSPMALEELEVFLFVSFPLFASFCQQAQIPAGASPEEIETVCSVT